MDPSQVEVQEKSDKCEANVKLFSTLFSQYAHFIHGHQVHMKNGHIPTAPEGDFVQFGAIGTVHCLLCKAEDLEFT